MIKLALEKTISRENLEFEEAYDVMMNIMNGKVNQSQIAALLTALKSKGETSLEIAGFVKAMRENSIKIDNESDAIDVCGTGGDESGTFNISTAVSFVVASLGIKVAKHGNRSISSKSGSADVLSVLGIDINMSREKSSDALRKVGITFMFAPNHHPAMKYVAAVRKELGFKTVFNLLGPLTNPANTQKQLIGTYSEKAAELLANSLVDLDMKRACVICTDNKYDEFTLTGNTKVFEYTKSNGISNFDISFDHINYPKITLESISGNSPEINAEIIRNIFTSKLKSPYFYVTAANSALALYAFGYSDNITECLKAAENAILSGAANNKLIELTNFCRN